MTKMLTAVSVRTVKPSDTARREIPDGGTGLYLVVQPSGAKSWAFRYRFEGRPRKLTLGPVLTLEAGEEEPGGDPTTGAPLTLKAARQLTNALGRQLTRGSDPASPAPAAARMRFTDLVDLYLAKHVRPNTRPRSAAETERLMRVEVLPRLGDKLAVNITRAEIIKLLDFIADDRPVLANRVLAALRALFNWAVRRDTLPASPCQGLQPPGKETSRDRVLLDSELAAVWQASQTMGAPYGTLIQLLIVTGQRLNEVAQIRWSEVDFDLGVWRLPSERSKNGRSHDVPLTPLAMRLIRSMPHLAGEPDYVFTTGHQREMLPPGEERRLTPISGFSKWKEKLDRLSLAELRRAAEKAGKASHLVEFTPWRLHDLRRTVATGMAARGVSQTVVERVLNHVGSAAGIVGVYQRHSYAAEKAEALQTWSDHLETSPG